MAEPTYRMSMLPFGTYANPDGTESLGLAVPGMIQEPINALMRLAENSRFSDGRLGIPNPDNAQNREDVLTGLLSMYGGNAMNPGRLMKGAAAKVEAPHVLDINKMLEAEATRTSDFSALAAGLRERGMLHPREADTTGLRPGLTVTREGAPGAASAWHDIALDGESIGRAYVREYPNSIQNSNFTLDPAFQRQGIGTEVQRELAQRYGKPTVPDSTLSEAAYQRWLKNDPAAVSDYAPWFEGSSQYAPIPDSSNYFSAMGRGPSPGTRGARGELFSDTGKPSLFGSAIAGSEHPIGHMPSDLIEQVAAAGTIPYAGVGQLSSTDTLVHQLMANSPTVSVKTGERRAGTNDRQGPPLTAYETTALDQAWRDKIRRTGELYSDTGLPSIWGNALAPSQDDPRNALLNY